MSYWSRISEYTDILSSYISNNLKLKNIGHSDLPCWVWTWERRITTGGQPCTWPVQKATLTWSRYCLSSAGCSSTPRTGKKNFCCLSSFYQIRPVFGTVLDMEAQGLVINHRMGGLKLFAGPPPLPPIFSSFLFSLKWGYIWGHI